MEGARPQPVEYIPCVAWRPDVAKKIGSVKQQPPKGTHNIVTPSHEKNLRFYQGPVLLKETHLNVHGIQPLLRLAPKALLIAGGTSTEPLKIQGLGLAVKLDSLLLTPALYPNQEIAV